MKKIFSLCLLCLMTLMAIAQSSENEGQQSAVKHRLRIKILPAGAVTTYVTIYQETGGYDRFGRLNYEKYATDTLDVIETMVAPGVKINIGPYLQGYKTKGWTANGVPLNINYSYDQSFDYMMPEQDVELVGLFEYDSQAPTFQPGAGGWYPETGTLVRDYEKGGSTFPSNFNIDEDKDKVLRYVLAGTMSDTYYIGKFTNCQVYDLSRTTHTEVGGYYGLSLKGITINEIVLPSTIQKLGLRSFEGTKVQTLTCFAVTPPEVYGEMQYVYDENGWLIIVDETTGEYKQEFKQKVFDKDLDMVVRVPAEAVALYQIADGWKNYTILPMDQNYVDLKLNLMASPNEATLAQYKNMSVELTNRNTGQTKRLLMNGRNTYEFRYLPENTVYSVALRNSRGVEIAKIDNVFIENKNVELTFDRLKTIHNLSVNLTEDNAPVDRSFFNNTWLTSSGEYIARGAAIDNMIEGEQLRYVLSFGRDLAMKYQQPDTLTTIVGQHTDNIAIELEPIASTNATFTVIDSLTRLGIDGATIQMTHILPNGERGNTVTLKTDCNGKATGKVPKAWNDITVNASMYGDRNLIANMAESTDFRVTFSPADGTSVQLSLTWQPAVKEGMNPQVEQSYSQGRSLQYEFTNTSTGEKIDKYLANYPIFTFYKKLPKGTKVSVKATSTNGTIEPVEAEGVVDANGNVAVTLPVVQRGYIRAKYSLTEGNKPAVIVFNSETGEVVRKQPFGDFTSMDITNLPNGNYLIAAMSQGMQYRGINSTVQLEQYTQGTDYVCENVSVSNGHVSEVSFMKIPLTMTQLETNLSERRATYNNSTVTLGYNAGVTVKVAFEGLKERMWGTEYDDSKYPTNCKLEFYVPAGMSKNPKAYRSYRQYKVRNNSNYYRDTSWDVYSQSVTIDEMKTMTNVSVGTSSILTTEAKSEWNDDERKLTVDWPHIDEGGKMQLILFPKKAGTYFPEAYLVYTLNGQEYREMLETEQLTVTKSGIKVPELIIKPTFSVSGTAMYIEEEKSESTETAGSPMRRAGYVALPAYQPVRDTKVYHVVVMDDDQVIGKAQINSDGEWKAECTLTNPSALSKHHIWAKISPQQGLLKQETLDGRPVSELQEIESDFVYTTEAKEIIFDPNGVVPRSVKMSFFNHHPVHLINQEVFFDLENQRATPRSYGYSNEEGYNSDFTFEINLSNNDPTKVYAVDLYIFTKGPDAEEFYIPAHYNARKDCWIAYEKFNTRSLPYDVNVRAFYHGDPIGSSQDIQDAMDVYNDFFAADEAVDELLARIDEVYAKFKAAVDANDEVNAEKYDEELEELYGRIDELLGLTPDDTVDIEGETMESISGEINALLAQYQELEKNYGQAAAFNALGEIGEGIVIGKAIGFTDASLLADGFHALKMDNGSVLYVKATEDNKLIYVSLVDDLTITISPDAPLLSPKNRAGAQELLTEYFE